MQGERSEKQIHILIGALVVEDTIPLSYGFPPPRHSAQANDNSADLAFDYILTMAPWYGEHTEKTRSKAAFSS